MTRWIDLLVDLLGYFVGVTAWVFIIWFPIATLIELWVTRVLTNYPISFLGVLVSPLIGLVFLWFERGLYAKKLGRLILVVLAGGGGLIFCVWSAVQISNLNLDGESSPIGTPEPSPWAMLPLEILCICALAIGIVGIAKRKTLQDIK